jgi:hypothetical protein
VVPIEEIDELPRPGPNGAAHDDAKLIGLVTSIDLVRAIAEGRLDESDTPPESARLTAERWTRRTICRGSPRRVAV